MNGNTTTGGSSHSGSSSNNNNNTTNFSMNSAAVANDYSFYNNSNTTVPQPTATTTMMNHHHHHQHNIHNPYQINHHRYTLPPPLQHGPSAASYDPSRSMATTTTTTPFYHSSPRVVVPTTTTTTTTTTVAQPYMTTINAAATLSPRHMTAAPTRDISPIPLHQMVHNNNNTNTCSIKNNSNSSCNNNSNITDNNSNSNLYRSSNNNNSRNIRARTTNNTPTTTTDSTTNNFHSTTTTTNNNSHCTTQQQQLEQLLFGNDMLFHHHQNDPLLMDDSMLLQLAAAPTTTPASTAPSLHRRSTTSQMYFSQQQQQHLSSAQQQQQKQQQLQIEAFLTLKASSYQSAASNALSLLFSDTNNNNNNSTSTTHASYHSSNSNNTNHSKAISLGKNETATLLSSSTSTSSSSDQRLSILHAKIVHEPWMDEIQLNVSSISLAPISGYEILQRIQNKLLDVVCKYVPCVDFLVNCQQELRRGMEAVTTQKRYDKQGRSNQNKLLLREIQYGSQFYTTYIASLSNQFYKQTKLKIGPLNHGENDDMNAFLSDAMKGLVSLQQDAYRIVSEQQQQIRTPSHAATALIQNGCCEAIKSAYLGGMKDGESWGLRKWLSKHGNALHVCTDLECILNACQKLPRSQLRTTRLLAQQLRYMTTPILQYLQKEIPPSYQKHSSAHPYLPFFHRLESALRSMSNFDPDDDDVICLDDDDDDDVVEVDPVDVVVKPTVQHRSNHKKRAAVETTMIHTDSDNPEDDEEENDDDPMDAERKRNKIHGTATTNGYHYQNDYVPNSNYNSEKLDDDDDDNASSSGESEIQSIVEIIDIIDQSSTPPTTTMTNIAAATKTDTNDTNDDWTCPVCSMRNAASDATCLGCGEEISLKGFSLNFSRMEDFFDNHHTMTSDDDDNEVDYFATAMITSSPDRHAAQQQPKTQLWPLPISEPELKRSTALIIANNLENIATLFDLEQQASIRTIQIPDGSFWDGTHYGSALRLFAQIIRAPESYHFLECVDDDQLHQAGNSPLFSHVIKHPLSLRQIARSLLGDEMQQSSSNDHTQNHPNGEDGFLKVRGLSKWNMWYGKDLLQAIDLVFLNSLAYGNALNQGRSQHRSSTNQLRKKFWSGISEILSSIDAEHRKRSTPTRRAEKSGFVVYKIGES